MSTIESIKKALGVEPARPKTNPEEGQEPVSGMQGAGTAAQPYDQGNNEEDHDLKGKSALEADNYNPDEAEVTRKASGVSTSDIPPSVQKQ